MKIVIAGGTGFIGKKLVALLCARGDEVTVVSRGESRPVATERVMRWDARTAPADALWVRAIDGADAVVNLAGAGVVDEPWTPARLALLRSSRTESTSAVCKAIASASQRPTVLVNASAVGYYGAHADGATTFDESSVAGHDVLGEMSIAWEAATKVARDAGVRVAIARIGIVLGDGGALAKMVTPFKAFVGGPIGSGKQVLSWIHGDDCARALAFAIDTPAIDGPFNVCGPNPSTMDEFAAALGKAMHRPALMRAPAIAVKLAMGERSVVVLQGQRVLPRRLVRAGFEFTYPDALGALRAALL